MAAIQAVFFQLMIKTVHRRVVAQHALALLNGAGPSAGYHTYLQDLQSVAGTDLSLLMAE